MSTTFKLLSRIENALPLFFEVKRSSIHRFVISTLIATTSTVVTLFLHTKYGITLPSLLILTSTIITIYGELILGVFFAITLSLVIDYFLTLPTGFIFNSPEDLFRLTLLIAHQIFLSTILFSFRTTLARSVLAKKETEQAKEEITLSEMLLRDAQAVSQVGSWTLDLQTSKVIWTEQSYLNFGVDPKTFAPSVEGLLHLLHPEDRNTMQDWIKACILGKSPSTLEFRVVLSDGQIRILEGQGRQILDAQNRPIRIVGTNRNITHSKIIENNLHQSMMRYKLLSDTMVQGVVHQDSSGKIILMNPAAERILGISPSKFLGSSSIGLEHICIREDGSPFPGREHPAMIVLQTGQSIVNSVMGVFNPKDQAYRWLNISAVPVFRAGEDLPYEVYTVFEDITEQKQAAEELEQARHTLIEAQKIAHLGSFEYIAATQMTRWSEEEYHIYGLNPSEPSPDYETLLRKCIHPDDSTLLHHTFTQAMQTHSIWELEHRIVRPDGSIRWVYDQAQPYFDKQGQLLRYIGITFDITERKNIEKALKDAKETAERANHAKDLFLATLSHELRTPLTAILSWAQILKSGRRLDPSKVQAGLQTIEEAAHAQNQLISDLLDISRIAVGKIALDIQDIELNEVTKKAIETVRSAADKKGIQITTQLSPDPIFVSGDAVRLKQIVWNLLTNSIKFTPSGGTIEVTLHLRDDSTHPHAQIQIRDSGKGISPRFLPHIFEQFFQADSSSTRVHGGMGLGLALVDSLVKLHDGTIKAISEGEGKGSIFTIELPLSRMNRFYDNHIQTLNPGLNQIEPSLNHLDLSGIHVLLVDDENSTLNSIKEMLTLYGAQVRLASSASEAIIEFEKLTPDVIVSDIAMPHEDGYSLIQKIRKRGHDQGGNTPAVALTAYADVQTRQKALSRGFQAHIAKPVNSYELVRTILDTRKAS